MSKVEDTILAIGFENVLLFDNPSYENAFVGISSDNRSVYNYDSMIECLMEEDGMDYEEAADFISYNTIRACDYVENAPIIYYPVEV